MGNELTRGKGDAAACLVDVNDTMRTVNGVRFYNSAIFVYVTMATIRTNQSDDILTFLITAIKLVKCIRTYIHFPRIMRCAALRRVSLLMGKFMSISAKK